MNHNCETMGKILDNEYPWYVKQALDDIVKEHLAFEEELRQLLTEVTGSIDIPRYNFHVNRELLFEKNHAVALFIREVLGIEEGEVK